MNDNIPTIKELHRILSVANDNPALASTLRSLRNAWLLCDTEYVNAHSEFEETKKQIAAMEKQYRDLKSKYNRLENKICEMEDQAERNVRKVENKKFEDIVRHITKTYTDSYDYSKFEEEWDDDSE